MVVQGSASFLGSVCESGNVFLKRLKKLQKSAIQPIALFCCVSTGRLRACLERYGLYYFTKSTVKLF